MSKAEDTRNRIIRQAADLFNQQGYAGASLSDVMQATGLQKGGIYNHFGSKDELALAAFDYAAQQTSLRYIRAVQVQTGAIAQLHAIVDTFHRSIEESSIQGGCPILNTAVDSDDAHPALRQRVQQVLYQWRGLISRIVQQGVRQGDLQPTAAGDEVATIMISMLEGSLMMTKLYGDPIHMDRVAQHLKRYIDQDLAASPSPA